MSTHKNIFLLEWFEREGDHFVGEMALSSFTREELHDLLGLRPGDHLGSGVFPVPSEAVIAICERLGIPAQPDEFEYFVGEVYLVDTNEDSQTVL